MNLMNRLLNQGETDLNHAPADLPAGYCLLIGRWPPNGTVLAQSVSMKTGLTRFDVFFALATVGAVFALGDVSMRVLDVSILVSLWTAYFGITAALRWFGVQKPQPALTK